MLSLKPALKRALRSLLAIVLALVGIYLWIGIRIGIWTYPEYDRHIWLIKELPIAHEFWAGKIRAGDDVEVLIRQWPPHQMDRFGPWVSLDWFPGGPFTNAISFIGINTIAKNGVLVSASAYSDDRLNDRVFFNTMTTNSQAEFNAAYKAYVEKLETKNEAHQTNGIPTTADSPK